VNERSPEEPVAATEPELGGVGEPVDLEEMIDVAAEVAARPDVPVPAELAGDTEPADADGRSDSDEPTDSAEGAEPTEPAEAGSESGDIAEPAGAAESTGAAEPADGTESAEAAEPANGAATDIGEPPVSGQAGPLPLSSELPDLTDDSDMQGAVEAILLVVDAPIDVESIADALEEPVDRTREVLERIAERYAESGSGIDLRRSGGGWRFYTRDRFAPFVEKLLLDGQRAKLTRAALETLAVIAYRQPVTRSRVAAVRGVNVDGVIRTLLARGLIEEVGTDQETGGNLYRTTELFLERLGLSSLEDLPPLAPLLPEVDAIDDV
jgi:segregation and condensation protein B